MNKLFIIVLVLTVCLGCEDSLTISSLDPKEKELELLPVGLKVTHDPAKVSAERGGRSGSNYTWIYKTTVEAIDGNVEIQEFGAFVWYDNRWVFANYTQAPFTREDFIEWYSCPNGKITFGEKYSDDSNWGGSDTLEHLKSKWYFIGINEKGIRIKGEAIVESLAKLK